MDIDRWCLELLKLEGDIWRLKAGQRCDQTRVVNKAIKARCYAVPKFSGESIKGVAIGPITD